MSHPTTAATLADRFTGLQQSISQLARRYERNPAELALLAVSKGHGAAAIRQCALAGQRAFAENYLQEALAKITECAGLPLTWHFIGHIQRNKTRDIATHFAWVHTVDRPQIAERLNNQRPGEAEPLNVCIQVNLDGAPGKGGVSELQLPELAKWVVAQQRLRLRGLMTIPEPTSDLQSQRSPYRQLAELFHQLAKKYPGLDTLSMGMSADMEAAIAEGATSLRIGTALFGPRLKNPQG